MTGIIIVNYQTWELSFRCMESIRRTCCGLPYRIYLVDNASPDPVPKFIGQQFAKWQRQGILYRIQAEKNLGYAAGSNLGMKRALDDGCGILIAANSDIVFQEHAVRRMAECLAAHPKAGIAGPKVLNEKGEVQASRCSMRTGMREMFQIYTAAKKIFRRKWKVYFCLDQDPQQESLVYHVSGCCFAMTGDCAGKILPLDEGTVLYGEELILGIRMEQEGFSTWYEPKSVVVHQHGASSAKVRPFMYQCISQSELYYCGKYLKAGRQQLWLLYQYRRLLYRVRSIRDQKLRHYWKTFDAETKKAYEMAVHTGKRTCGKRRKDR